MKCFRRRMRKTRTPSGKGTTSVVPPSCINWCPLQRLMFSVRAAAEFSSGCRASRIVPLRLVATGGRLRQLDSWLLPLGHCRSGSETSKLGAQLKRVLSRHVLPGGTVQFRRPPPETRPALGDLIKAQPKNADLYSLRALEDEQQLDFTAAESDWKKYAESASSKDAGQFALADFYHRRVRPLDEIKALEVVAASQA